MLHPVIKENRETVGCHISSLRGIHLIKFVGFNPAPLQQLGINDVAAAHIGHQGLQASAVVHIAHWRNPFALPIIPGPEPS
ncbi:MAG: Uncharacterised protein [Synechococcus sp. CC9902]|nr:MAG: Uncharacterised protein [Synechococcus sp. CC9902]